MNEANVSLFPKLYTLAVIKFSNISPSTVSRVVLNPMTKNIPKYNLNKDYSFTIKATWQVIKKAETWKRYRTKVRKVKQGS
jgi:hypothetical protein